MAFDEWIDSLSDDAVDYFYELLMDGRTDRVMDAFHYDMMEDPVPPVAAPTALDGCRPWGARCCANNVADKCSAGAVRAMECCTTAPSPTPGQEDLAMECRTSQNMKRKGSYRISRCYPKDFRAEGETCSASEKCAFGDCPSGGL